MTFTTNTPIVISCLMTTYVMFKIHVHVYAYIGKIPINSVVCTVFKCHVQLLTTLFIVSRQKGYLWRLCAYGPNVAIILTCLNAYGDNVAFVTMLLL